MCLSEMQDHTQPGTGNIVQLFRIDVDRPPRLLSDQIYYCVFYRRCISGIDMSGKLDDILVPDEFSLNFIHSQHLHSCDCRRSGFV